MSGETVVTVIGNICKDPELTVTKSDKTVAAFTIATNPRHFKDGNWVDGDSVFFNCQLWGKPAEHVTDSLTKGQRVIATGRLIQRSYETSSGDKRTVTELVVTEIGPSLMFGTTKFTKTASKSDDPWSSTQDKGKGRSSRRDYDDEPPF